MSQETITVAYCNPPGEGKKQATIKSTAGAIYGLFPDKLAHFKVGQTYTVEVQSREFQGRTFKTIKSIVHGGNGTQAAPAPSGAPSYTKAEEMFIMGVLGRCYQGTGSLPDALTLTMNVRNLRRAWREGFQAEQKQDPAFEEEQVPEEWR